MAKNLNCSFLERTKVLHKARISSRLSLASTPSLLRKCAVVLATKQKKFRGIEDEGERDKVFWTYRFLRRRISRYELRVVHRHGASEQNPKHADDRDYDRYLITPRKTRKNSEQQQTCARTACSAGNVTATAFRGFSGRTDAAELIKM